MRMAVEGRLPEPPAEGDFAAEGDWAESKSTMGSGTILVFGVFCLVFGVSRQPRRTLEARECPNLSRPSKSPVRLSPGNRIPGGTELVLGRMDRVSARMGLISGGTGLLSGAMGQGDL